MLEEQRYNEHEDSEEDQHPTKDPGEAPTNAASQNPPHLFVVVLFFCSDHLYILLELIAHVYLPSALHAAFSASLVIHATAKS